MKSFNEKNPVTVNHDGKPITKIGELLSQDSIREKIFSALEEMGISFSKSEKKTDQDINLSEYLQDSMQLILFALALEENIGFELTDDILIIDTLQSLNALIDVLMQSAVSS